MKLYTVLCQNASLFFTKSLPFLIAEVKRLLPEWGIRTGSKSYMRIQFILYGNKSFISV